MTRKWSSLLFFCVTLKYSRWQTSQPKIQAALHAQLERSWTESQTLSPFQWSQCWALPNITSQALSSCFTLRQLHKIHALALMPEGMIGRYSACEAVTICVRNVFEIWRSCDILVGSVRMHFFLWHKNCHHGIGLIIDSDSELSLGRAWFLAKGVIS